MEANRMRKENHMVDSTSSGVKLLSNRTESVPSFTEWATALQALVKADDAEEMRRLETLTGCTQAVAERVWPSLEGSWRRAFRYFEEELAKETAAKKPVP
jgi:hypothetical protein